MKCVDWHPHKGLIASGSKDTQQPVKLWDPRTGASLSTVYDKMSSVTLLLVVPMKRVLIFCWKFTQCKMSLF